MATYVKNRRIVNPDSYNVDLTDKKVDWILDEAKLERKVETYIEVVPAVITLPDFEISVEVDILEMEAVDYELPFDDMLGVSASDEQAGDLTEDIELTYFLNEEVADPITAENVVYGQQYTLNYGVEDGAGNTTEIERLLSFSANTLKLNLLAPVEGDTVDLRFRKDQVDKLLNPGGVLSFSNGVTEVLYGEDRFVITGIDSVESEGTTTVTISLESLEDGVTQDTIAIVVSTTLDDDFYGATVGTLTPSLPQVIKAVFSEIQS